MADQEQAWYGVKGLFRWYFKAVGDTAKVEERAVLFRAKGFDDALEMAERRENGAKLGPGLCGVDVQREPGVRLRR